MINIEYCPGCNTPISLNNAGGYRTYCDKCVNKFPPQPQKGVWFISGRYPDFKWEYMGK